MASIAFVVPRFHTNLFFATKALIAAGHRVAILVETRAETEDYTHVAPTVLGAEPARVRIWKLLDDVQPDLVFLRHPCALSRLVAPELRRRRVRVLTYDQQPATWRRGLGKRLSWWWQGRAWERITPVPGLDPDAALDRAAHFLPFPVEACPLAVDAYRDQDALPLRVLCVGKLGQTRKRQDALIAALEPLSDRVVLTLVGSTDMSIGGANVAHRDRLHAAAATTGWITLCPDRRFDEMPALYAKHHVCVLPSVGEPLGSAPLEGMAYGTVPVISDCAGSAGYIRPYENGLRVDMSEPGALAAAMAQLADDAALRQGLSEGARHFAASELSPGLFAARVAKLLR